MDKLKEAVQEQPNPKVITNRQPEDDLLTQPIDDTAYFFRMVREAGMKYGICRTCGRGVADRLLICDNCFMGLRSRVYPFSFGTAEDLGHMHRVVSGLIERGRDQSEIDSYVHRFSESLRRRADGHTTSDNPTSSAPAPAPQSVVGLEPWQVEAQRKKLARHQEWEAGMARAKERGQY